MLKVTLTLFDITKKHNKLYILNVLILKQEYKYINLNETINSIIWKEQGAVSYQNYKALLCDIHNVITKSTISTNL